MDTLPAPSWKQFTRYVGDLPIPISRYLMTAKLRLFFVVPVAFLPTARLLHEGTQQGWNPEAAWVAFMTWICCVVAYIPINILLYLESRKAENARSGWLNGLNACAILCEITTDQAFMYGFGSLANYSVGFVILIIVLYRVLFDYRTAVGTTVVALGAYIIFALMEGAAVLPVTPMTVEPVVHSMSSGPINAVNVSFGVLLIGVMTFGAANFAVGQAALLHRYITESVLRRYLPPAMVAKAARGELALDMPPERRTVTVMFTDIVGFTPLTEEVGPVVIGDILNKYLGEIADLAHEHGATVDKFIGDCVMLVFGAPESIEPEEQARRAVMLAREIHKKVLEIDVDRPLQARTGINTGEAVVGNFGSLARSDYTVLGPAVNVAARLEGKSSPGRIVVGETTADLIGDLFPLESMGPIQLKGVADPVLAYVVGE